MKITDLTIRPASSVPASKHIEVVSCLQNIRTHTPEMFGSKRSHFFYEFKSSMNKDEIKEIVRLAKIRLADGDYDLIAFYFHLTDHPSIYLGHWNDGVVEE